MKTYEVIQQWLDEAHELLKEGHLRIYKETLLYTIFIALVLSFIITIIWLL